MNNHEKFDLLAQELGFDKSSDRSVDLNLDDVSPVRLVLHPDDELIVITFHFFDTKLIDDEMKQGVYEALLMLNDYSAEHSHCYVGMDEEGLLVLIGLAKLEDQDSESLLVNLAKLQEQALKYQELVEALAGQ